MGIDHAADQGFEANGDEATNADAGEGEASEAQGPVADLGEDDRVGYEAEVKYAVDYGYIDVPEDALKVSFQKSRLEIKNLGYVPDWLGEYHNKGAAKIDLQQLEERSLVVVIATPISLVIHFFSTTRSFLFEQDW